MQATLQMEDLRPAPWSGGAKSNKAYWPFGRGQKTSVTLFAAQPLPIELIPSTSKPLPRQKQRGCTWLGLLIHDYACYRSRHSSAVPPIAFFCFDFPDPVPWTSTWALFPLSFAGNPASQLPSQGTRAQNTTSRFTRTVRKYRSTQLPRYLGDFPGPCTV